MLHAVLPHCHLATCCLCTGADAALQPAMRGACRDSWPALGTGPQAVRWRLVHATAALSVQGRHVQPVSKPRLLQHHSASSFKVVLCNSWASGQRHVLHTGSLSYL